MSAQGMLGASRDGRDRLTGSCPSTVIPAHADEHRAMSWSCSSLGRIRPFVCLRNAMRSMNKTVRRAAPRNAPPPVRAGPVEGHPSVHFTPTYGSWLNPSGPLDAAHVAHVSLDDDPEGADDEGDYAGRGGPSGSRGHHRCADRGYPGRIRIRGEFSAAPATNDERPDAEERASIGEYDGGLSMAGGSARRRA